MAASARNKGNHPFGALLVRNQEIVLEAENSVTTERDVTRHAELNLVSEAAKKMKPEELANCVLYSSTEPCAMCAGAIYWSGIRTVVFGLTGKGLGKIAGTNLKISSRDVLSTGDYAVEVVGPICELEAAKVHEGFW